MRLYQTNQGIAREDNDALAVLDVPHPRIADLLGDTDTDAKRAPIRARLPKADAVLLALASPEATLIIVGANYRSHIDEAGLQVPQRAFGLPVPATAVGPPFAPIILPAEAPTMVDYEGEIAVLIGRAGRDRRLRARRPTGRNGERPGDRPREDHPRQDVSQLQAARSVRSQR